MKKKHTQAITLTLRDDVIMFNNRRYVPADTLPETKTAAVPYTIRRMDMRLRILQALRGQPNYTANDTVLTQELQRYGHALSPEQLRVELSWLKQVADALVYRVWDGMHIATLNDTGYAVSSGYRTIPGIASFA